jgi:ribosomal protein L3 glutamine methyltransferase
VIHSTADTLISIRDVLRYAVSRFNAANLCYGHGFADAYDEAVYLILHTLHLPLDRLDPFFDARLLPSELTRIETLLEKRINTRSPAAYLTREAWLAGHRFYVDERVIVPRSFIGEVLHDGLVSWLVQPDAVKTALDLCTGSGCLAILLADAYPNARIDAVDLSPDALDVARRNVSEYDLDGRIRLLKSDLFGALAQCKYDLIVANPPYVTAKAMAELPAEYRREPILALASGSDGLDHIRRILREASIHLTPDGILVVEAGHNRDALEKAFPELPFTWLDTGSGEGFVFLLERSALADLGHDD